MHTQAVPEAAEGSNEDAVRDMNRLLGLEDRIKKIDAERQEIFDEAYNLLGKIEQRAQKIISTLELPPQEERGRAHRDYLGDAKKPKRPVAARLAISVGKAVTSAKNENKSREEAREYALQALRKLIGSPKYSLEEIPQFALDHLEYKLNTTYS